MLLVKDWTTNESIIQLFYKNLFEQGHQSSCLDWENPVSAYLL